MSVQAQKVALLGLTIDNLSFDEFCERVAERVRSRRPGYIVTPNSDHVCRFHKDRVFRDAYSGAFLVVADGVPLLWASRLFRSRLRQKLSGSDLVPCLSRVAAERGFKVSFVGGAPGTAETTARKLHARYPGLQVAGVYCPPYGFEKDPAEVAKTVAAIRAGAPDICFVALGTPKQEVWMHEHCDELGVPVLIGVGAAFDFVSGRVRRAPRWVQHTGFEWLWRLAQEPRRLWRRYLIEDVIFFRILWHEFWKSRRNGQAPKG